MFGSGIGSSSNPASCMKNCTSARCRGIGTATRTLSVGSVPAARRGSSGPISILFELITGHDTGGLMAQPRWQSVHRSPLAVEERYVNCGTWLGELGDDRTAHLSHSQMVFRSEASSAPRSAKLYGVGPLLWIVPMF